MYTIYLVSVNLFTQVYEMFNLDPASWAALVAQLVRASVRSAECRGFKSHLRQLIFLSFFLSFFLQSCVIMYILRFGVFGGLITPIYLVSVNLFTQVFEMFDLDPASWAAALVAQLVRASVRSAECRGFKSHLRQLIFHFFICLRCLSFFLSSISRYHVYT